MNKRDTNIELFGNKFYDLRNSKKEEDLIHHGAITYISEDKNKQNTDDADDFNG